MPAAASPTVRALQAVGTVPVEEIAYANADDMTGEYSMTLPSEAPWLAPYATTLPLTFSAQAGSAGQYTIEASATGYVTQTMPADVSSADVTGLDFTVVPQP